MGNYADFCVSCQVRRHQSWKRITGVGCRAGRQAISCRDTEAQPRTALSPTGLFCERTEGLSIGHW